MIIGVLEYGEVRVFEGIDHVMKEWGAYSSDVASGVIVFYDANGVWLEPIVSGASFELRRNPRPATTVDPLGLALFEATDLAPNQHFKSLSELRTRFPFSQ